MHCCGADSTATGRFFSRFAHHRVNLPARSAITLIGDSCGARSAATHTLL